ncbi:hypothetical protein AB0M80_27485 [Amycolatopsis sp. NPDC051045]|uniref:hypothetical protein n=1 Tax=Amycolatopsis sp. NPDC051045 TaxID=3156922 RepID=UPI003419CA97
MHPTRLAFEGVGLLAVLSAGCAAAYHWWLRPPPWPPVAGFALGWLLGAAVTVLLRRAFRRASDL